jgi:hypothetical protein
VNVDITLSKLSCPPAIAKVDFLFDNPPVRVNFGITVGGLAGIMGGAAAEEGGGRGEVGEEERGH